jgi:hypothetical protein
MEFLAQVNWIAVVVGAIFNMAFGMLWYGPLFGRVWLKAIGNSSDDIESNSTMYVLPFFAGLVASCVLAIVIAGLGMTIWWHGILLGVVLWLGIGSTATLTTGTFEGSPRGGWLLFTGYQLVVYGALGLMFVLWTR